MTSLQEKKDLLKKLKAENKARQDEEEVDLALEAERRKKAESNPLRKGLKKIFEGFK